MISFYGILDFFPKRVEIKEQFDKLTLDERILYKKEVYSLCFEREYTKDLIWEYLNGWTESQFDLAREYRLKKNKRSKYESNDTLKIIELERYNKSM